MKEGEKMTQAVRSFKLEGGIALVNMENLAPEEKLAVEEALAAYDRSTNSDFRAGACAVGEDGTRVATHNEIEGQQGHAERLALAALYRAIPPGTEKKLKIIALAGSKPGENVIRQTEKYGKDTPLEKIQWAHLCGHCLKFINDYTAGNTEDVIILSVAATGQVVRTSLRALYPVPHQVTRVPLGPLRQRHAHKDENGNGSNGELSDELKKLKPFTFPKPPK